MGFEIPGWLKPVMNIVAGPFPEGDETAMRRLAEEWETIGYAIAECKACTDPAMTAALSAIEGEIHKGMDDFWKHVSKDGGLIEGLSAYCDDKAKQLYEGANEIELTKYVIVGSLVALAAQLMIGVAIPLLGQAENAAAIIATRVGIRMAIRELIKKLLEKGMMSAARKVALRTLREAAIGAVFMGGVNLAAQDIQGLKGDRDSLNWGSLGQSLGMGAAAGAVGGPLGLGIGTVLGRTVSTGLGRFAVTTVAATAGGLAGAPAAMAAPALWGQEVHLDPHVILNGGIVGAVTGGATHGVHTVIASRAAANAPHVPTVLPQLPDSVVPLAESAAAAGPKPALAAQAEAPPVVHPEPAAAQGDPAIQAASAITPETVLPGDAAPAPAAGGPDAPASATTTPHP
ncbi:MAG: hypothetical protein HOQ24_14325, partial [Mycobacteriaceae bacterium]|nr:hypothetical protein [Mycobacteriaceae bacterium]